MKELVGNCVNIFGHSQTGKPSNAQLPSFTDKISLRFRLGFQDKFLVLACLQYKATRAPSQGVLGLVERRTGCYAACIQQAHRPWFLTSIIQSLALLKKVVRLVGISPHEHGFNDDTTMANDRPALHPNIDFQGMGWNLEFSHVIFIGVPGQGPCGVECLLMKKERIRFVV